MTGISCLSPFAALAAIITGILGLSFARKNAGVGSTYALFGLILGILIMLVFLGFFIYGFMLGLQQGLGAY